MGEISKLGWLIGLLKHAIWADSLYFLYLLLLSISKILASFILHKHVGLILIFIEDRVRDCTFVLGAARMAICLFVNIVHCQRMLETPVSFRSGFHELTPKSVFSFQDGPHVVTIPRTSIYPSHLGQT
jgi:hypothetical protein